MTTLAARVLEAIEAAEALALAASPGPWHANAEHDEVLANDDITVCDGFALSGQQLRVTVDFIVDNAPDAVLRRCAADRKIVALYTGSLFTQECHPEYEGNNGYVEAMSAVLAARAEAYGVPLEQEET